MGKITAKTELNNLKKRVARRVMLDRRAIGISTVLIAVLIVLAVLRLIGWYQP